MSKTTLGEEIKDWVISIIIALVLAFTIRYFIVELYMVDGPSMTPTLLNGERLVVNKFIYHFETPKKGDIIVFRQDPTHDFIKRVIATAGDTIEVKDGKVIVNGKVLNEPYILDTTRGYYPLTTVPAGHIFVMGDNRNNSEDSRYPAVGFVSLNQVKGEAVLVFWPLDHLKTLAFASN
jgi:signal peptidase I